MVNINTTQRATIYIRAINIERDGKKYGTYYQAVRSYRENGKVKQDVVHLGEHATADDALQAWANDVRQLQTTGHARPKSYGPGRTNSGQLSDSLRVGLCQTIRQLWCVRCA